MNDDRVIKINAQAAKQGFDGHESRIVELENQVSAMKALIQTLNGQMIALQQANTLALQQLRGTGPTA